MVIKILIIKNKNSLLNLTCGGEVGLPVRIFWTYKL